MSFRERAKTWIAELAPYVPGKPPELLERELGIAGAAKLASNENPLGPSPKAVAAMREAVGRVHRYPDGGCYRLRAALAERFGIERAQLVFGCGSSELLELLAKTFLGPEDEIVVAWPSFAMYPIVAQGMGARAVRVPLDAALTHDLEAMAAAVGERTRIVIVCNPNNPTGTSVGRVALERFATALPDDVVLVIDEAYGEYAQRSDFPDGLALVAGRPGTITLRTFSKLYGLAGARIGFGVADLELAGLLERARHPFNVTLVAEAGALAALDDDEHVARTLRVTHEGLALLQRELGALGYEVVPSDANFVLVRTGSGAAERLERAGVIVRPMAGFGLPEHVRVTVGTPEENARLIAALRTLREEQPPGRAASAREARP